MKILKVGIVVDDYKVDKMKRELTGAGYEFKASPLFNGTTHINVQVPDDKIDEIKKLCQKVEFHFKHSN
jgi:hypothetical protein